MTATNGQLAFALFAVVATLFLLSRSFGPAAEEPKTKTGNKNPRVPVTLFVMSQCPDAARCQDVFSQVLAKVDPIVEITTDYIAKQKNGKLSCPHGPNECEGDKQQLCARKIAVEAGSGNNAWFDFVTCQSARAFEIPGKELLRDCAKEANLDADKISACASGTLGNELLLASAKRTVSLGVSKSCTIHIADKHRCITDGGVWYDCKGGHEVGDFVKTICEEFEKLGGDPGSVPGCPSRVTGKKMGVNGKSGR